MKVQAQKQQYELPCADQVASRRSRERNPVNVQLLRLEELPEPLSKREFGEVCQLEGLPQLSDKVSPFLSYDKQLTEISREVRRQQEQLRWNNTLSNLFGAYMAIYDNFKKWHNEMIEEKNIVGPEKILPFSERFKKENRQLVKLKEQNHKQRHRRLINVLIEYGLGVGPLSHQLANNSQPEHPDHLLQVQQSLQSQHGIPSQFNRLKNQGQVYGPVADLNMIQKQLGKRSPSMGGHLQQNVLQFALTMNAQKTQRQSRFNSHNRSRSQRIESTLGIIKDSVTRSGSAVDSSCQDGDVASQGDVVSERKTIVNSDDATVERTPPRNKLPDMSGTRKVLSDRDRSDPQHHYQTYNVRSPSKWLPVVADDFNQIYTNPNTLKLVKELKETKEKLAQTEAQLELSKQQNKKVMSKYIQEESNRYMNQKTDSKSELIKNKIESRFFDVADGLEPHMMELLNTKIAQMREVFFSQIQNFTYNEECMLQKVAQMERLNQSGFKLNDLNTERIIELLSLLEEEKREQNKKLCKIDASAKDKPEMFRPKIIWDQLSKQFGNDYFLDVIEDEYGIAPGYNDRLSTQIENHFETNIEKLKTEHVAVELVFKRQINQLQEEVQDLVREKTQLMRRAERDEEKMKQENQRFAKILVADAKESIEKRYKKALEQAYRRVEEMTSDLKGSKRTHKNMQLNYGWKRWLMFAKIKSVLIKMEKTGRTEIDNKMLSLAERFVTEDFLIKYYSRKDVPGSVPETLVIDSIKGDRIGQLKSLTTELQQKLKHHQYFIEEYEQSIQEYQCEVSSLALKLTDVTLKVPALESQNEMLEQMLQSKEVECCQLAEKVENIQSRWKSQARDSYKLTANSIMAALQLKSMNEVAVHKFRTVSSLNYWKRSMVNAETITKVSGINYPLAQRVPCFDKNTQASHQLKVNDIGIGDHDIRQENRMCGTDRDMGLIQKHTQTKKLQKEDEEISFINQAAEPIQIEMVAEYASPMRSKIVKAQEQLRTMQMKKLQTSLLASKQHQFPIDKNASSFVLIDAKDNASTCKAFRGHRRGSLKLQQVLGGQPKLTRQKTFSKTANSDAQSINKQQDDNMKTITGSFTTKNIEHSIDHSPNFKKPQKKTYHLNSQPHIYLQKAMLKSQDSKGIAMDNRMLSPSMKPSIIDVRPHFERSPFSKRQSKSPSKRGQPSHRGQNNKLVVQALKITGNQQLKTQQKYQSQRSLINQSNSSQIQKPETTLKKLLRRKTMTKQNTDESKVSLVSKTGKIVQTQGSVMSPSHKKMFNHVEQLTAFNEKLTPPRRDSDRKGPQVFLNSDQASQIASSDMVKSRLQHVDANGCAKGDFSLSSNQYSKNDQSSGLELDESSPEPINLVIHKDEILKTEESNQMQPITPIDGPTILSQTESSADVLSYISPAEVEGQAAFEETFSAHVKSRMVKHKSGAQTDRIQLSCNRRLTLVKEHENEHELKNVSSSRQSSESHFLGDIQSPPANTKRISVPQQQRKYSEGIKLNILLPGGSQSRKKSKKSQQGLNETFRTSQDSDSEYNRRMTELTNKHSHFTKSQKQQSKMPDRRSIGSGNDQDVVNPVKKNRLCKIKKLLVKGYISEEQFLCLKLLEKGFVPASIAGSESSMPKDSKIKHKKSQNSRERNFSCKSQSMSSQQKLKQSSVYKIYPKSIRALEKIFDRVYSHKGAKGVKCDPDDKAFQNRVEQQIDAQVPSSKNKIRKLRVQQQQAKDNHAKAITKGSFSSVRVSSRFRFTHSTLQMPQEKNNLHQSVASSNLQVEGHNHEKLHCAIRTQNMKTELAQTQNDWNFSSLRRSVDQLSTEQSESKMIKRAHMLCKVAPQKRKLCQGQQTQSQFLGVTSSLVESFQKSSLIQLPSSRMPKPQKFLKLKKNNHVIMSSRNNVRDNGLLSPSVSYNTQPRRAQQLQGLYSPPEMLTNFISVENGGAQMID